MSREKFIVLDVEGCSNCRPYNIGYIIADRYGKIYKKHSFSLNECIWENLASVLKTGICADMTKKNIQEILSDCSKRKRQRKYKDISVNEFYKLIQKEISKYKISKMYAYNITFDKNALKRLLGERFDNLNLEYRDIISGILYTKLLTKKYINYCKENNYITDKGNIQYKAEIVYKYLTGNVNFQEEHTGLADVLIEYEILLTALNYHKKINWKPCQAWKKLKDLENK